MVDRRVEGALRPFGVPRLVSLKSDGMLPRGQSLPHRGYSLPIRSSLIGYSVPNPDLLGPGLLSGHYAGPSYYTRHIEPNLAAKDHRPKGATPFRKP